MPWLEKYLHLCSSTRIHTVTQSNTVYTRIVAHQLVTQTLFLCLDFMLNCTQGTTIPQLPQQCTIRLKRPGNFGH